MLDEEVTSSLGVSLVLDESSIGLGVLLEVLLSGSLGGNSGSLSVSLSLGSSILDSGSELSVSSLLLEDVFWDDSSSVQQIEMLEKMVI